MRVNPNIVPDLLTSLNASKQQQQTYLLQMSSGKRVNKPSDDPVAAARDVSVSTQSTAVDQYTSNVTTVQSMVQDADSILGSVVTQLTRAVTLGTEGATGTSNQNDVASVANEVSGILTSVTSLANSTFRGLYLFSGTKTTTQPFVADASAASGFTYNGNSTVNSVAIGESYSVNTNVPGNQLFLGSSDSTAANSVLGSLTTLVNALKTGTSTDIRNAVSNVNNAINYLGQQRVFYGNAESQLSSQQTQLSTESTNLATDENNLVAADMTTSITEFAQAAMASQAAMSAAGKVLQQNLLDYLK